MNVVEVLENKIKEYERVKKGLKMRMMKRLAESLDGLMKEKNDEYKLYDQIELILDDHNTFDFTHNAIMLLEQLIERTEPIDFTIECPFCENETCVCEVT